MTLFITLTFMIFATAAILTILSIGMYFEYRKGEKVPSVTKPANTYIESANRQAKLYEELVKTNSRS